jgi:hypothetical protein
MANRSAFLFVALVLGAPSLRAQRWPGEYRTWPGVTGFAVPSPLHYLAPFAQEAPRASARPFILTGALVGGTAGAVILGPTLHEAEVAPQSIAYGVAASIGALLGVVTALTIHRIVYPRHALPPIGKPGTLPGCLTRELEPSGAGGPSARASTVAGVAEKEELYLCADERGARGSIPGR